MPLLSPNSEYGAPFSIRKFALPSNPNFTLPTVAGFVLARMLTVWRPSAERLIVAPFGIGSYPATGWLVLALISVKLTSVGSVVVVPSTMFTVPLDGEPTVYAALPESVRMTDSPDSATPSLTGETLIVADAEPAGIVTVPLSDV